MLETWILLKTTGSKGVNFET